MEKIGKTFQGKVAIVTASTQGIGFGIAERLGLEGASVVISSRKQVSLGFGVILFFTFLALIWEVFRTFFLFRQLLISVF